MKEETPIDKLINIFEEMIAHGGDSELFAAIEHAKELKKEEKQGIITAYDEGEVNGIAMCLSGSQEYFTNKYKQK